MSDDTVVSAVVNWVNSFDSIRASGGNCTSLSDLSDGRMCLSMLSEIAPAHFEASAFGEPVVGGNWALSAANIKRLVRMIDEYYRSVLHKHVRNINSIDATAIAKASDVDELLTLLELVVGVAVMCDNRAAFIQKIFSLDSVSQSALKHVVEQVMSRTESLADAESEEDAVRPPAAAAAQHHLEEMISHLQNERLQHVQDINSLQRKNDELAALSQSLKAKLAQFESEKEDLDNTAAHRGKLQEAKAVRLQHELNDVQRELDLKSVACDTMRSEMVQMRLKLEAASQGMAKLEMESHQLGDELDVARDKAAKLVKAEAQIDKYQRRLEELATVKQENKELVEKLDQYMDKIHDLESSNKNIGTINKMIEQYKDKAVDMEREKFQAVSALQMHQHEYDRMVRELEDAIDGKRFLEEELAGVRAELEQHMAVAAELNSTYCTTGGTGSGGDNGRDPGSAFETESAATLREKVKLLEIELRDLRASSDGGAVGSEQDAGAGSSSSRSASASALRELTSELAMVKAELQIASSVKSERDEMLISSKKTVSELQLELQKSNRACAELEKSVQKGTVAAAALKDTEQKLALCENTLRLLEANMKEKEGLVSRLEQDKSKLETFSKSTLLAFKEKYMKALKAINDEKKSLEERLAIMIETNERNQVTSRREEHLMLSALYEVGVKIMDRNIEARFGGPIASLATPHKSAASDLL